MSHIALYRKYRSQTFGDLVGQEHVIKTLQSALARGKTAHAYLFTGPRGTGKTSTARLLAKALNCEKGPAPEPCNECQACREITQGNAMDVLELDAASESGVEGVRQTIVEAVDYQPSSCRYRIFIIDEVHDLSRQAFDALLKTIEEPPPHVVFILATTEFSKVPPTIRSRCQRFEFHRGTLQDLVKRLTFVVEAEKVEIEPAALTAIARMSDGGYRDALTLLEQAILTTDGPITLQHVYDQLGLVPSETVDQLLGQMASLDVPGLMETVESVYRLGRDPRSVLESLLYRLADLTRAAYGVEADSLSDATQEAALKAAATTLGAERILAYRSALATAHAEIRDVTIPRVWLEAELVKIARESVARPSVPQEPHGQREPIPVRAKEAPKEPQKEQTSPEQTAEAPAASDDPVLDKARSDWAAVLAELSGQSNVARERLSKTKVDRIEEDVAYVEFASTMILELVNGSKLEKGIREAWARLNGGGVELVFFAGARSAPSRAAVESTAVELPAEGERLAEIVQEVFGSGGRSDG